MDGDNDHCTLFEQTTMAELPCWNCGALVLKILPFVGCIYCGQCSSASAGTEDLQWGSRPLMVSYIKTTATPLAGISGAQGAI